MRSLRAAAALVALAVALTPGVALAAPAGPGADGADLITVSEQDGGGLSLRFRDATGVEHQPAGIRLGPGGGLSAAVPDHPDYAFLGPPGRAVWSLSAGGSRFPAIDTTGVRNGSALSLRLDSVDGPGGFAAYTVSRWGAPTVLLDSDGPAVATLRQGERLQNVAWTFDATGVYRLGFTAEQGGRTASAVYTVEVPAIETPAGTSSAGEAAAGQAERSISVPGVAPQARAAPSATSGTQTAATATGTVLGDGHVDMGPQLEGGTWRIRLKDDAASPPVWRELSDVVLKVTDKAKIPVPAGSGYAFLGAQGSQIHLLPQTQQAGIVWPGWNTQHASVTSGIRGDVTWSLTGVDGPGAFALFLTSSFGTPQVLFDSAKPMPQQLAIPLNTHAHGNWAFTKPGLYRLSVRMSATTTAGKPVTDTRTLTFAVGDATDAGAGFSPGSGSDSGSSSGSSPASGSTGGALAFTGVNVLSIVAAGLVLTVLGFAAVVIGRRRTVTQHTLPPA